MWVWPRTVNFVPSTITKTGAVSLSETIYMDCCQWTSLITVISKVNNSVEPSFTLVAGWWWCIQIVSWDQVLKLINMENEKYNCKKYCDQHPFNCSASAS